jgi:hypothetical protein
VEYTIGHIQQLVVVNRIKWNAHATQRMLQRTISRKQVIDTLMCGQIIEEYPEDYPYPSCLVFGFLFQSNPLHVVCSIGQESLWIITVYRPDNIKWHNDYKTRREVK